MNNILETYKKAKLHYEETKQEYEKYQQLAEQILDYLICECETYVGGRKPILLESTIKIETKFYQSILHWKERLKHFKDVTFSYILSDDYLEIKISRSNKIAESAT